jgi:hypothetical protein
VLFSWWGRSLRSLNYDISLERTNELLKQENVIVYEAAFLYKNLFIRTDILEKRGKSIRLLEVKAKSFDKDTDSFTNKNGKHFNEMGALFV